MVLGASNYTYVEATLTQTLPDFLGSHVRAFEYFGATPLVLVPDQLRSAITGPDRYDPEVIPTGASTPVARCSNWPNSGDTSRTMARQAGSFCAAALTSS
jgi:hypothetical protein